jgi:hypothetical protein
LQQLTQDQKAAVAVAALYEATEPFKIFLAYELDGIGAFTECVELILKLSYQGKLALTRALAEELGVLERLVEVKKTKFPAIDLTDFFSLLAVWELNDEHCWELVTIERPKQVRKRNKSLL